MTKIWFPFAPARASTGFTLVELVVVMVVIGIVATAVGLFVGAPIRGFVDQSRRAAITDAADLALLRMARDLRSALPNSIRVSGDNQALELLRTVDGDRYRVEAPGGEDDRLTPGLADAAFNTLRPMNDGAAFPPGARLSIYPIGDPWNDASLTPAGITVASSTADVAGTTEGRVTLSAPHLFPQDSPSRRVYLVEGPVSYLCSGGRLLRYSGYAAQASQPVSAAALDALAIATVVADGAEACAWRYEPGAGAARRFAVASLALQLESADERVRLLRQVHVDNSP